MVRIALFLFCMAGPVWAGDFCSEAWFTRNLIMNRAGYCFSSNLGQALFDNRDCFTQSPSLSARDQATVLALREDEKRVGCRVNTGGTWLDIPNIQMRLALPTLPRPDEVGGFGCFGWRGGVVPLFWDVRLDSQVIGQVAPGDDVFWWYYGNGPWSFITVERAGQVFQGWSQFPQFDATTACTRAAG